MPGADVYLQTDDYQKAQADLWETQARQRLADAWEQNVRLKLPDILGQTQQKLQNIVSPPPPQLSTPAPVAAPPSAATSSVPSPSAAPAQSPIAEPAPAGGDLSQMVMDAARKYGIDPNTALSVAQSEGGLTNPTNAGDSGSSFGPFQLHYGNVAQGGNAVAGLGDEFTKQTGLDARDPANVGAAIDFALKNAATQGWGAFHGAARAGIDAMQGIGGQPSTAAPPQQPIAAAPATGSVSQRTSQFSLGLSDAAAYAACGPAAAIAFANTYGRNPTPQEAVDLATKYGWTPQGGMAGIQSEQQLLSQGMGIPTKLEQNVDWGHVAADASAGNPVIVSTPGHYFYIGQDPATGKAVDDQGRYYVGTSGTDLKGGGVWMSPAEMQSRMGKTQGALYADNPQTPGQSIASTGDQNPIGQAFSNLGSAAQSAIGGASVPASLAQNPYMPSNILSGAEQAVGGAIQSGANALGQSGLGQAAANAYNPGASMLGLPTTDQLGAVNQLRQQYFPSVLDPNHPSAIISDPNATPEQKQQAMLSVVSGVEGGGLPNANRARAIAADVAANPDLAPGAGTTARAARLRQNAPEAPIGTEPFTRTPQGDIAPVQPAQQGTDLLQAMIDEAKQRKVNPELVDRMQTALNDLSAPPTPPPTPPRPPTGGEPPPITPPPAQPSQPVAAGGRTNPLVALGRTLRAPFQPALNAPQGIQDALNTYNSITSTVGQTTGLKVLTGTLEPEQANQIIGTASTTARKGFLNDVGNAGPDAVTLMRATDPATQMAVSVPKPGPGWIPGHTLDPTLGGLWVSPETATVVRNTLNHEITVPGLAGLAKLSGQIKQVGLTGSPFHFVQEQLQAARLGLSTDPAQTPQLMGRALANGVNPAAYKSWLTTPAIADTAAHAASDGVTFGKNAGEAIDLIPGVKGMAIRGAIGGVSSGISTYGIQRARGVPEEDARNQAILAGALGAVSAGPLGAVIGPATFEREIPTLKILGYKMLTDGGVAGPDAASMVNNQFGGQNLNRMARDPNFQAILRSVALAPDWWESWFRNAGTAIPGVPVSMTAGNAARKNVAVTVAGAAMTLEGLNYLFTGHGTADNAPNHQLDLEIPASMIPGAPQGSQPLVHVDVLGPLKPLAQVAVSGGDIGAFVKSRLSAPAGFAVGALQNKNPVTGAPLVQPGTPPLQAAGQYAASELGSVMPAGAQGIMQGAQAAGPGGAALAGLSGLRVSASSAQPVSRPVQAELDRLHKLGYTGVSLPYPDASFIIGNSRIDLTADERRQLASLRGSIVDPMITKTMQSPAWSTATDDAKANYIQTLSEQASTLAKQRLLASLPPDVRSQRLQAGLQVRGRLVTSR